MTLNLDDIARLAGVSRTTVSRVINDRPEVSESTRRTVQKVIEEVKFHPNIAARMLASQRNRIIGVAVCNPTQTFRSDYGAILFEGISGVTNERDYATLLYWEQSHSELDRFSERILQQNRLMDGMLMASTDIASPLIDHLVELKIPFVMLEKPTKHEDVISYVTIDNVQSAVDVVEHLIKLGRKRIGHIVGLTNKVDAQDRLTGYRKALQQWDLPFDPRLVTEGSFSRENGYRAMKELLARDVQLDAVFVGNDDGAEGGLVALREAGVRVPDDIAIVGFDDVPNAQHCIPQLTTIHQPIHERGARATDLLLDIIEGAVEGPQHVLLPTHLVVRQSCGAKV
jgi:LacI family transcriptional regulator